MSPSRRGSRSEGVVSARLIRTVRERLSENKRLRRTLPIWGRIAIDRQLPFLVLYRRPTGRKDRGTDSLVTGGASYLTCSGLQRLQESVGELVEAVAETMVHHFGSFLLLEVWAGHPIKGDGPFSTEELAPRFKVLAQKGQPDSTIADVLAEALGRIKLREQRAQVSSSTTARCGPRRMAPIMGPEAAARLGCHVFGIEVTPVYRDPEKGELFPQVLRQLRGSMNVALRRALFEFATTHTTHRPAHYHALGRRAMVKAVWEADRILADVSDQFDFLLQLTPVNGEQAWHEFERSHFERQPVFHYRPLPADPVVMKRALFRAPVERIEDPALARIFREKLVDLDREITMLQDRNTPRFMKESEQLYGGVEDDLHDLALELLRTIPSRSRESGGKKRVTAKEFASRAQEEIAFLREQHPELSARVELRSDVAGLMVSHGNLLVSTRSRIPASRVEALIQHEVGTHILTYHNGRAQKLRQLSVGLASHEALQEGLAVLAEYLVGGLSRPRMRLLAARVVAARTMLEGASFVDTFRELDHRYDFSRESAFTVTMRIYRSGGLTKDAVYLRGLKQILEYVGRGGAPEPLFVGKIAAKHIPIIQELQWRKVLREPPLAPGYLRDPAALARLERLRQGITVTELVGRSRR